ncbi:MAG: hypothetical protein AB1733_01730 [Thermodesulfobacteriota bacterium]
MKKTMLIALSAVLITTLGLGLLYAQQTTPGTTAPGSDTQQQQGWYCPWCGGGWCPMMGQGGMMGRGGMWMHRGGGMGYPGKQTQPLSLDQAKVLIENQLRMANNPNLKLGKVTEEKDHFLGEITTKEGSLVDRIQVDKNTGGLRSMY